MVNIDTLMHLVHLYWIFRCSESHFHIAIAATFKYIYDYFAL